MVDEKTVEAWLEEVTKHIRENTAEIARLRGEIGVDTRRQTALKALLAAATNGSRSSEASPASSTSADSTARASVHPIEQGAICILQERGEPVHISELRAELSRRGIPIPGKGNDANVIVYLARSAEVCRIGRGLYALRAWGVPEVPSRRRRATRKGQKRKK